MLFLCFFLCRVSLVLRPAKITDVKEQRICTKFSFKLGKPEADTHKMIKEAFGDTSLGLTLTYEWFKRFKNGCQSITTSVLDDLRQEPRSKMWQKCERLSWKTEDERFTTSPILSDCRTERAREFCPMSCQATNGSKIYAKTYANFMEHSPS